MIAFSSIAKYPGSTSTIAQYKLSTLPCIETHAIASTIGDEMLARHLPILEPST